MPSVTLESSNSASIHLLTSSTSSTSQYHLLELTPDILKLLEISEHEARQGVKRMRNGQHMEIDGQDKISKRHKSNSLCIKGRHGDEATLCTETETFALREMTQTNSLLLCSLTDAADGKLDKSSATGSGSVAARVCSNVSQVWELTPIVARTGRIGQLLGASLYSGEEEEKLDSKSNLRKLYTPQQLASIVQASAKELQAGIDKSFAVLLDGHYRKIASCYLAETLQHLLNHIDLQGDLYEKVPLQGTLSVLQNDHGLRSEVAEAVILRWFGRRTTLNNGTDSAQLEDLIEIDVIAITRFLGLQVLETKAKASPLTLECFLAEWEKAVGPNLSSRIDVQLLKGHHLTFPAPPLTPSDTNPATIQYFAASDLPLDPTTRVQQLFQKRPQWTLEHISPYLDDVAIDIKKRDALLLKYARCTFVRVPVPESKKDRKVRLRLGIQEAPMQQLQLYSSRLRYG